MSFFETKDIFHGRVIDHHPRDLRFEEIFGVLADGKHRPIEFTGGPVKKLDQVGALRLFQEVPAFIQDEDLFKIQVFEFPFQGKGNDEKQDLLKLGILRDFPEIEDGKTRVKIETAGTVQDLSVLSLRKKRQFFRELVSEFPVLLVSKPETAERFLHIPEKRGPVTRYIPVNFRDGAFQDHFFARGPDARRRDHCLEQFLQKLKKSRVRIARFRKQHLFRGKRIQREFLGTFHLEIRALQHSREFPVAPAKIDHDHVVRRGFHQEMKKQVIREKGFPGAGRAKHHRVLRLKPRVEKIEPERFIPPRFEKKTDLFGPRPARLQRKEMRQRRGPDKKRERIFCALKRQER